MHLLKYIIVVGLSSVGLSLSSLADVAFFDFEGAETGQYWRSPTRTSLTSTPGESIQGDRSLKLDTLAGGSEWNELLVTLTNGVTMQGGKRYAISLQYNVLQLNGSNSYFYMLARSQSGLGPDQGWTPWTLDPHDPSSDTIHVVLPAGVHDYRFIVGVHNQGALILDNIRITAVPDLDTSAEGMVLPDPDYEPYGVCEHLDRGPGWGARGFTDEQVIESLTHLANAGVQWLRTGIGWHYAETSKNSYSATYLARIDLIVNTALSAGMNCYVQLGGTPQWASEQPGEADYWAYGPSNVTDWADFVQFIANRYNGRVRYWEVHNEPDWTFWKSEFTNYVPFLQTAFDKLKAVDSANQVILGGLATDGRHAWTLDGAEQYALQRLYDAGAKEYFDILGLHSYPGVQQSLVDSVDDINTAYDVMVANGDGGKPIWMTEIGWSSHDSTPAHLADQALVLSNLYTHLVKHPRVAKIFWYNYRCKSDEGERENNFGMVENDFTFRPAYGAFSNLVKATSHKGVFDWGGSGSDIHR